MRRRISVGSHGADLPDERGSRRDGLAAIDVQSARSDRSARLGARDLAPHEAAPCCNGELTRPHPTEMPLAERNNPIKTLAPEHNRQNVFD